MVHVSLAQTTSDVSVESVESNQDWQPEIITLDDGSEMVRVPPGCFTMGVNTGSNPDESPTTTLCFDEPFLIDRYEFTNRQDDSTGYFTEPEQPRDTINWLDAVAACANRTYEARPLRLPTEAEWEYAARGPDSLTYPWGMVPQRDRVVSLETSENITRAVGSVPSGDSWVGAADMAGNVWEWTSTIYDEERFPYPYPDVRDDGREDPDDTTSLRVLRGGSANNTLDTVYAANRFGRAPGSAYSMIGFRCAISLSESTEVDLLGEAFIEIGTLWEITYVTYEGVEMVYVPGGCFLMGSIEGDNDEKPVQQVCINDPFYLDRYEVTRNQFGSEVGSQLPQTSVSWYEAAAHCEDRGGRLPTEAEWEFAARGVNNLTYTWGNDFTNVSPLIWQGNSAGQPEPVGTLPEGASWVGAENMAGNVSEWTSSIHDQERYPYPYDAADGRENPEDNSRRVVRGSNFNAPTLARSADRDGRFEPIDERGTIGFRCLIDLN